MTTVTAPAPPEAGRRGLTAHLVVPGPGPGGEAVLVEPSGDGRWRLPAVPSPDPRPGVVEAVAGGLRVHYGLDGTVLRCLDAGEGEAVYRIERHDRPGRAGTVPEGCRWVRAAEIAELSFADPGHKTLLLSYLASGDGTVRAGSPRPWTEPGWYARAAAWIETSLAAVGHRLEEPPRPLRSEAGSCLMTARAGGATWWFKATPARSRREAALTRLLAELRPAWLPPVAAVEPGEGWVLLGDAGGRPLTRETDPAVWERALSAYATLQADCVGRVPDLLALGCPDLDPAGLRDDLGGVVERALEALAASPTASVGNDLRGLRSGLPGLRAALAELADGPVPTTLEHGDFHPDNLHITTSGPVILDWSDGSVSHPFFSLAAMLTYVRHLMPGLEAARERLIDAYLEPWGAHETPPRLRALFATAERVSGLHYARLLTAALGDRSGAPWETRELSKALALCLREAARPLRRGGWRRR